MFTCSLWSDKTLAMVLSGSCKHTIDVTRACGGQVTRLSLCGVVGNTSNVTPAFHGQIKCL